VGSFRDFFEFLGLDTLADVVAISLDANLSSSDSNQMGDVAIAVKSLGDFGCVSSEINSVFCE
jgi:hypothetical protein